MRRESREPTHKAFLCQANAWGVTSGEATRRRSLTEGSDSVLMIGWWLRVWGCGSIVAPGDPQFLTRNSQLVSRKPIFGLLGGSLNNIKIFRPAHTAQTIEN